jgi:hypothetical protein
MRAEATRLASRPYQAGGRRYFDNGARITCDLMYDRCKEARVVEVTTTLRMAYLNRRAGIRTL